jgi:hypothetical protein
MIFKRTLLTASRATKLRPGHRLQPDRHPLLFQHQFHIQYLPIVIKAQQPLVMLRKAFHPQTFLLFHPKCSSYPPSHPLNSPKDLIIIAPVLAAKDTRLGQRAEEFHVQ